MNPIELIQEVNAQTARADAMFRLSEALVRDVERLFNQPTTRHKLKSHHPRSGRLVRLVIGNPYEQHEFPLDGTGDITLAGYLGYRFTGAFPKLCAELKAQKLWDTVKFTEKEPYGFHVAPAVYVSLPTLDKPIMVMLVDVTGTVSQLDDGDPLRTVRPAPKLKSEKPGYAERRAEQQAQEAFLKRMRAVEDSLEDAVGIRLTSTQRYCFFNQLDGTLRDNLRAYGTDYSSELANAFSQFLIQRNLPEHGDGQEAAQAFYQQLHAKARELGYIVVERG